LEELGAEPPLEVPTEELGEQLQSGGVCAVIIQPLAHARVSHARQFHGPPPASLLQSDALSCQVPPSVEAGNTL
jgi:hypothetical protein